MILFSFEVYVNTSSTLEREGLKLTPHSRTCIQTSAGPLNIPFDWFKLHRFKIAAHTQDFTHTHTHTRLKTIQFLPLMEDYYS